MNITMIVPYFKPEITAVVHLMDDLAHDFGKYGANVTVITGFPLRGTSEAVRKVYFSKNEEQIEYNVRVFRVGSKHEEGKNLFIRGFKYIAKTYEFYQMAKQIPSDVYFLYSTPPVVGVIGSLLSKKAPTLYCLQDIFPDNMIEQGKINNKGIILGILRSMEKFIYKGNTLIVTISNDMKKTLIDKKVDENKISIIGNWVDTDKIKYITRDNNPLFEKFNLERSSFYVTYSGNLGHAQDIKIILDSAKLTEKEEPGIQYIIIGNGAIEEQVQKQIIEEHINNVRIFPLQAEEDTAYVYSLGDIGLVTLKENMCKYAMPSKSWAMMAASQPIICTAFTTTQLYEIISGNEIGVVIMPGDHKNLAKVIIDLFHDQQRLKVYGLRERAYAEKNLSRESATKKYFELLKELAEKRSG